jgi:hypothetical protein
VTMELTQDRVLLSVMVLSVFKHRVSWSVLGPKMAIIDFQNFWYW